MSGLGVDVFSADNAFSGGGGGSGLSAGYLAQYFGDGLDGDAVISGTTTLTKEMYYNNLTITGTGTLKPAGFRIFVKGTLTIDIGGSINDDGNSAVGQSGGASLAVRQTLGAGAGNGGGGGSGTNGNSGGTSGGSSPVNSGGFAPAGANGGNGGANVGGTAGAATAPIQGQRWYGTAWQQQGRFNNGTAQALFNGGSGGGGGASSAVTCTGGGGGGGGGIVWLSTYKLINNGRISANGGKGADGFGTSGSAGGGGGGGGGLVCVGTTSQVTGVIQAVAGQSGVGFGGGGAGGTARDGSAFVVVLS